MIELNYMQMLENARNDKNLFNLIHNRFVLVPDDAVLDLENTEYFKNKGGDFKNYYMSTFGRIYGPKGFIKTTGTDKNGKLIDRVSIKSLDPDNKRPKETINRWILNTWNTVSTEYVDKKNDKKEWLVTNIDRDKTNRKLNNLTYLTRGELNTRTTAERNSIKDDSNSSETKKQETKRKTNINKPVKMINADSGVIIKTFPNSGSAATYIQENFEEYKNDDYENIKAQIRRTCINWQPTSRGFKWEWDTTEFDSIEWNTIDPKHLNNYEGTSEYGVSRCGKVANLTTKTILDSKPNLDGYVYSHIGGSRSSIANHRLVGLTFIPNDDPKKTQINHKNGIQDDNRVENLEWVSCRDNINHAVGTGLKPKTCKKVELFNRNTGETIKTYDTKTAAARDNKVSPSSVTNSINKDTYVTSKETGFEYSFRELTNT